LYDAGEEGATDEEKFIIFDKDTLEPVPSKELCSSVPVREWDGNIGGLVERAPDEDCIAAPSENLFKEIETFGSVEQVDTSGCCNVSDVFVFVPVVMIIVLGTLEVAP